MSTFYFFCKVCLTFYAKYTILFLQSKLCKTIVSAHLLKANFAWADVQQKGITNEKPYQRMRKANKLSQSELADIVGTTRQTITSIEVGKYTASLGLAYKIAHHFNLTIEEVFDFSEIENEE